MRQTIGNRHRGSILGHPIRPYSDKDWTKRIIPRRRTSYLRFKEAGRSLIYLLDGGFIKKPRKPAPRLHDPACNNYLKLCIPGGPSFDKLKAKGQRSLPLHGEPAGARFEVVT